MQSPRLDSLGRELESGLESTKERLYFNNDISVGLECRFEILSLLVN